MFTQILRDSLLVKTDLDVALIVGLGEVKDEKGVCVTEVPVIRVLMVCVK